MLAILFDENVNGHIVRAVQRRCPDADTSRVQDVGLRGADDPTVLAWAAERGRVLVTHDVATVTRYAYQRVAEGQAMPGVVEVAVGAPMRQVIDDLVLLIECSLVEEWEGQVLYVPLS